MKSAALCASLLLIVLLRPATLRAEPLSLRIEWVISDNRKAEVRVHGLPDEAVRAWRQMLPPQEQLQQILSIRLRDADPQATAAMLGEYTMEQDTLVFRPRFALLAGHTYQATLHTQLLPGQTAPAEKPIVADYSITAPTRDQRATRLTRIYPTADVLPENQLKFYLHFSAPMSRGVSYQHIELWDDANRRVEFPFLELPEELWDPQYQRFTLFFDPGRIKRGLKPRELFGPALEEGRSYTLIVQAAWPDAQGRPLTETVRKQFRVVAPDDEQPDTARWKITAPAAGSQQRLRVRFDEPLDHGLAQRVIWVEDTAREKVAGTITVSDQERSWMFVPAAAWRDTTYTLVIDTCLEDLAGNSLARPFEVDLFDTVEREPATRVMRLEWQPRGD